MFKNIDLYGENKRFLCQIQMGVSWFIGHDEHNCKVLL